MRAPLLQYCCCSSCYRRALLLRASPEPVGTGGTDPDVTLGTGGRGSGRPDLCRRRHRPVGNHGGLRGLRPRHGPLGGTAASARGRPPPRSGSHRQAGLCHWRLHQSAIQRDHKARLGVRPRSAEMDRDCGSAGAAGSARHGGNRGPALRGRRRRAGLGGDLGLRPCDRPLGGRAGPAPALNFHESALAGRAVDFCRRRAGFFGRPRPMLKASSRRCCA